MMYVRGVIPVILLGIVGKLIAATRSIDRTGYQESTDNEKSMFLRLVGVRIYLFVVDS